MLVFCDICFVGFQWSWIICSGSEQRRWEERRRIWVLLCDEETQVNLFNPACQLLMYLLISNIMAHLLWPFIFLSPYPLSHLLYICISYTWTYLRSDVFGVLWWWGFLVFWGFVWTWLLVILMREMSCLFPFSWFLFFHPWALKESWLALAVSNYFKRNDWSMDKLIGCLAWRQHWVWPVDSLIYW